MDTPGLAVQQPDPTAAPNPANPGLSMPPENKPAPSGVDASALTEDEMISYTIGASMAKAAKAAYPQLVAEYYARGFLDIVQGNSLLLTEAQMDETQRALGETGNDQTDGAAGLSKSQNASYVLGTMAGKDLRKVYTQVDANLFGLGCQHAVDGGSLAVSLDEMEKAKKAFQQRVALASQENTRKIAQKNAAEEKAFLAENAKKPGVVQLPNGLQYKVLAPGQGACPIETDRVRVNYRGTFLDGSEFDSSYGRNKPADFHVNALSIKGWTEALTLMNIGAKWIVWIPSPLAYGEKGRPGIAPDPGIGPNKLLIVEMELITILPPA
jgi:FKBP-type peptidyl-prolyl cis-trans isomerase